MERWTFLIIADETGSASQIRIVLRAGEPQLWPTLQVKVDGTEVALDDTEKDYEAPEWKAVQLFTAGGGSEGAWEGLKDRLRARAA